MSYISEQIGSNPNYISDLKSSSLENQAREILKIMNSEKSLEEHTPVLRENFKSILHALKISNREIDSRVDNREEKLIIKSVELLNLYIGEELSHM